MSAGLRVTFDLSAKDVRYFRDRLRAVEPVEGEAAEARILKRAAKLVSEATASDPPEFVGLRLAKLELLADMLVDEEWRLVGRDRARILHALAYFVDPDDLIPDVVPGIGYLDDAIMIELVVQDLMHELKAYEDFCEFRRSSSASEKGEKLGARRKALQTRMRRRRRRDRETRSAPAKSSRASLRLW